MCLYMHRLSGNLFSVQIRAYQNKSNAFTSLLVAVAPPSESLVQRITFSIDLLTHVESLPMSYGFWVGIASPL